MILKNGTHYWAEVTAQALLEAQLRSMDTAEEKFDYLARVMGELIDRLVDEDDVLMVTETYGWEIADELPEEP